MDQLVQPKLVAFHSFPGDGNVIVPGQELALELDVGGEGIFLAGDVQSYARVDLALLVVSQLEFR